MIFRTPYRRIAAHYVYVAPDLIPWGIVTIDAKGTVVGIESNENLDSHYGIEFYSGILIPGMVNSHTHLELSCMAGVIPRDCGFVGFAAAMGESRGRFSFAEKSEAAACCDARMYADGISAVADISNDDLTFGVKCRSKIAYHTFVEMHGLKTDSDERAHRVRDEAISTGLRATITPHSTYSLNEQAFRAAVGDGRNSPLSIHFMESEGEAELFSGRGELMQWYGERGWRADFVGRYSSAADRIISCIPADRRVMLVHNTFITQADMEALNGYFGRNLTWVLCPRSNSYITGAQPPVSMLMRGGGRISIGTDSAASNEKVSMIGELAMFRGIPLVQLLRWATLSGAEALGLEDTCGSLHAGKRPGVVLLEGVDLERMELLPNASTRRLA